MPDPQRAQLVPDAVARAHRHAQQARADGVLGAEQALHARRQGRGIPLRGQQAREQLRQPARGVGVALRGGGDAAGGFDAVVDGADAGAEPDAQGGRGAEGGAEDDEAGADGEVLEGVFVPGEVVGGAGEGGVFARGEGGGDADDGEGGGAEGVAEGGGVEVEGREIVVGGGVVGEREGGDFGGVGEASAAEGHEDVGGRGAGFVDDGEDVAVVGVGFDAPFDAHDGAGADAGFEGGDEGGEVRGGAAEGAGGEDVDAAGVEGGGDVVGAGGGVGGAVGDVGGGVGGFAGGEGGDVGFVGHGCVSGMGFMEKHVCDVWNWSCRGGMVTVLF